MTPAEIVHRAAADGVGLALSPAGTIKASGNKEALATWQPVIRERKAEIVDVLAELTDLVRACGEHYQFSEAEHVEALECALADPAAALVCFRTVVREIWPNGLNHEGVEP
jgi:hypothetical protein